MKNTTPPMAIFPERIFTGNPARPWAQALLIKNNIISAVGTAEEIAARTPVHAHQLALPGHLVTPGLIDGHCHLVNTGVVLQRLDLRGTTSLSECKEKVKTACAKLSPGQWIVGRGWNQLSWGTPKEPSAWDLDGIAPDHPVMLTRICGHCLWLNSLALKTLEISRHSTDPDGGKIEKDRTTGKPNGIIRETTPYYSLKIPRPDDSFYRNAALSAQDQAISFGITGVHSCEGLKEFKLLHELEREKKLKLRVYHLLHPEDIAAAETDLICPEKPSEKLWFNRVKLYEDGSLGAGTALLHEPYEDAPGSTGLMVLNVRQLEDAVRVAYDRGLDVAIHAIGDRAVTNCLNAFRAARKGSSASHRDRIEHVQLFRDKDIKDFTELGITASAQPAFLATDYQAATRKWGPERCQTAYAWQRLSDAGIALQFGSDSPIESIDPLYGIKTEMLRTKETVNDAYQWVKRGSLTLAQCIRAYTFQPAWTSRQENRFGTISPGMLADLTIFRRDLFEHPPRTWQDEVAMTVINGEIVYSNGI